MRMVLLKVDESMGLRYTVRSRMDSICLWIAYEVVGRLELGGWERTIQGFT